MPINCAECNQHFISIKQLLSHLRNVCTKAKYMGVYRCGVINCFREYSLLNSLRKHIAKQHGVPDDIKPNLIVEQVAPCNSVSIGGQVLSDMDVETECSVTSNNELMSQYVTKFISSLYANVSVPRSVVKTVISSILQLVSQCLELSPQTCKSDILSILKKKLTQFDSEYKCLKILKQLGTFIPPEEVSIGQRLDVRKNKNMVTVLESVPSTMQIIPLSDLFTKFFSTGSILKDTIHFINELSKKHGSVTNFIQGNLWRQRLSNISESEITLPLIVYYDDFETGNPLGSHAGIHKLGGVYVAISCLPPMYQSKLDCIFLLGLFHASDRERFGNSRIFGPMIAQLNILYLKGIKIENSSFNGTIKFKVGALIGDNLGLHSMLGFVESFSANYPCRICKVHKAEMKKLVFEDETLYRNTDNYVSDLHLDNCSLTGIKEACVWLALKEFNIFQNVGVDVMHDILEGCSRYIFSFLINHFMKATSFFTIETLNEIIFAFEYGPDSSSKPNTLSLESSVIQFRMSASEMLTFIRYFGLMVGSFVPRNYPIYELYISLKQVTEALLSRVVRPYSSDCLQIMISELNELYIRHSGSALKPKFHFLTHYHKMLDKFGPLSQIWSMRFEANHRISKFIARSSFNRINICKSIALRNQLYVNNFFIQSHKYLHEYNWGKHSPIPEALLSTINEQLLDSNYSCKSASWLKIKGESFKRGSILTTNVSEETNLPTFSTVTHIFTLDKDALFRCQNFSTVSFDRHYQAYEVVETSMINFIKYSALPFQVCNNLNKLPNAKCYITIRHFL